MQTYEKSSKYLQTAANYYLRAGFESSSDYAKATQSMFDAYVFMEAAKREREPEKQTKNYLMAEKVLQSAADCFRKANYTNKVEHVQKLLRKVREEKQFALSLNEIFQAPSITSSTATFSTLSPREETAVGLERFETGDVQAKLVQHETETEVGNIVALEIQLVNVGRDSVSLTRIEDLVPEGFQIVSKPDYFQFENSQLVTRGKKLDPLKTIEINFTLRSYKNGTFEIKPRLFYLDTIGQQHSSKPEPIIFHVSSTTLPGRIPTGYADLDNLLLGGIPETYCVALTSPAFNEAEKLFRRFLETGTKNGQTTYCVTTEVRDFTDLVNDYPSTFSLLLCNPRSEVMIKNLPNVIKIKGIECLTDIDIALLKSFRTLQTPQNNPRRMGLMIVSDVLLQHHAVTTRKWLGALLAELKSKGFTTLALINPEMHPTEEVQAILSLFDGEIKITEKETPKGPKKTLRIKKMYNQRYLENEVSLSKEKLEEQGTPNV